MDIISGFKKRASRLNKKIIFPEGEDARPPKTDFVFKSFAAITILNKI